MKTLDSQRPAANEARHPLGNYLVNVAFGRFWVNQVVRLESVSESGIATVNAHPHTPDNEGRGEIHFEYLCRESDTAAEISTLRAERDTLKAIAERLAANKHGELIVYNNIRHSAIEALAASEGKEVT